MQSTQKQVLFVCTGNAGRSQMAEILFARLAGKAVSASSAGVAPWPHLHPVAVRLLKERGIDTSERKPRHVRDAAGTPIDWVILIGDRALTETPRLKGNPVYVHWDIPDPADADGTGQEEAAFRKSMSEIESRLPDLLARVKATASAAELHGTPGISTCIVRPEKFHPATHLPLFVTAGFSCIELNCFLGDADYVWSKPSTVAELRRVADETGIRIYAVHAEGGLGGMRGRRSEQQAMDLCKAYADLACQLGAHVVTMHAGLVPDEERSGAAERLRYSLENLAHHVRGMPCRYGWENEAIGLSTEEHLQWIRDLGPAAFGFVLDTGHSNVHKTTKAYLDGCRGLLCDLHLNDNAGTYDQHQIPGKGSFSWKGMRSILERNDYTGPLMLELLPQPETHDLAAVCAEARSSLDLMA